MNSGLNIALVVDAIEIGGVETYLFSLGRYFKDAGHHVTIVVCARRGEWWEKAKSLGISCVCLHLSRSLSGVSHARKIGRFLAGQPYDCILLNHSKYGQASLGMLPENVIAIPVIHNDVNSVYNLACSNSKAWNIAIGVSPKLTRTAKTLLPDKTIETVPNGVRSPAYIAFKERDMLEGKIKMMFVGRISHSHKGVFYLPEIVRGCIDRGIDLSMTIVGDGGSLDSLKRRIWQARISDRVAMVGVLSQDGVYQKMLEHHILLMPSHYEGFGLVALEAQACGCVPIASRLPGITDQTIDNGRTGMLVNVGDIDAFVTCIDKLYKNPLLWHTMSEQGHSKIEREASIEVMGKAYLQIIGMALLGKYPLKIERKQSPQIDKSLFTWRDYVPIAALRAGRYLRIRVK
jgi:glycosyltransferase involved in cell wall biosynthesis